MLVTAIDLLDAGAHAARDEREADHHHRQHDGLPREDHVDADGIKRLAHGLRRPNSHNSKKAGRDRRQDQRQEAMVSSSVLPETSFARAASRSQSPAAARASSPAAPSAR
jgi:hypothetical protein